MTPMQCNLLLPESPLLLHCAIEGGYNLKDPEISSIPLEPFCWTMPNGKALAGCDPQGMHEWSVMGLVKSVDCELSNYQHQQRN